MLHIKKIFPPIFGGSVVIGTLWAYGGGDKERAKVYDGPEVAARLSRQWWEDKWSDGQSGWRKEETRAATPPFAGNVSLVESTLGRKVAVAGARALVPLCGDSSVVVHLAQQGMQVTAIDYSDIAVQQLRAKIKKEPAEVQARIQVLQRDFLSFSLKEEDPKFDFVYDKAAFVNIDPALREAYVAVLQDVTTPSASLYLQGVIRSPVYTGRPRGAQPPSITEYAPWVKVPNILTGPPHNCPSSELQGYFKDGWAVHVDKASLSSLLELLSDTKKSHGPYRAVIARAESTDE